MALKILILVSERGVVWEETIILLPDNVHYVFLSATIPNARQFAEWIAHLHKQVSMSTNVISYEISPCINISVLSNSEVKRIGMT